MIGKIGEGLTETFAEVDTWFDRDKALRTYRPAHGGWTVNQILEHIALTNHFLLILIDKGAKKALKNKDNSDLQMALANYSFDLEGFEAVGITKSFDWPRPEHMEPTGRKPLAAVRVELAEQVQRCQNHLTHMPNGEGVLYRTTMTVNNLGKIDVYQYIWFLVLHARRHLQQLNNNQAAYHNQ